jgi:hypothetical protein
VHKQALEKSIKFEWPGSVEATKGQHDEIHHQINSDAVVKARHYEVSPEKVELKARKTIDRRS